MFRVYSRAVMLEPLSDATADEPYRGTSLIRNHPPPCDHIRALEIGLL